MSVNPELTEQLSPHTSRRPASSSIPSLNQSNNHLTKPLYHVWPARSKALFKGRVLLGVHWLTLGANILITVIAVVCFVIWVSQSVHWLISLFACLLAALSEFLLLKAALSDPGIVCRQTANPADDQRRDAFERVRNALIAAETRRAIGLAPITPYINPQYQSTNPPNYQLAGYPAPLLLDTPARSNNTQDDPMPDESQIITLNAPQRPVKQQPINQSNQSTGRADDATESVTIDVDAHESNNQSDGQTNNQPTAGQTDNTFSSQTNNAPFTQTINQSYNQTINQTINQLPDETIGHLPPPFPPLVYGPGTGLTPEMASLAQQYVVPCQKVARRSINQSSSQSNTEGVDYDLIPLKYCATCCIYRPYGASHCRDCDQCVTQFDHHCPWISNCVGSRNHRWFVGFILSLTALVLYVFIVCLYVLINAAVETTFDLTWSDHLTALVLAIFCFVIGWCMVSLSVYHIYLIVEHTTTSREIKARRDRMNQYNNNQSNNQTINVSANQSNNQSIDQSNDQTIKIAGVPWPKRELYPPVELPPTQTHYQAIKHFFFSPLPPPLVDMDGMCVVDQQGKVLQYPPIGRLID